LQKFPALEFTVTTQLELAPQADADSAGLIVFGFDYAWIGLKQIKGRPTLVLAVRKEAEKGEPQVEEIIAAEAAGPIPVRVQVKAGGLCQFYWSQDSLHFTAVGQPFTATVGHWVGAKVGLFSTGAGHADFDWFRFTSSKK
jgi:beta-xylosidase